MGNGSRARFARGNLHLFIGLSALIGGLAAVAPLVAQQPTIPTANVNVISGIGPDGDWTLQRQNEPSGACSSRNPLNCMVGANDYRTVDIPNPDDANRVIGDAWLGWYTTKNGGQTWRTRLLPGYPQDVSPQGLASPLKGMEAGADPVVRSGANGMFFYAGIAFVRGEGGGSRLFVARFIDNNDRERTDAESIQVHRHERDPVCAAGHGQQLLRRQAVDCRRYPTRGRAPVPPRRPQVGRRAPDGCVRTRLRRVHRPRQGSRPTRSARSWLPTPRTAVRRGRRRSRSASIPTSTTTAR